MIFRLSFINKYLYIFVCVLSLSGHLFGQSPTILIPVTVGTRTFSIEMTINGLSSNDDLRLLKFFLYKMDGTLVDIDNHVIIENPESEYKASVSYPGYIMSYYKEDGKHALTWNDATPIEIKKENLAGEYIQVTVTLIPEVIIETGTFTISGTIGVPDDDDYIYGLSKIRPISNVNGNVSLSKTSVIKADNEDKYELIKTIQTTEGHYTFSDLPEGHYRITADLAGYDPGIIEMYVDKDIEYINFMVDGIEKTIISESETLTEAPSWQARNLKVYPNPTTDVLHVSGLEGVYTVKMINILGQLLSSVNGSSPELMLNVGHLPSGMYFLRIESNKKTTTHKIIKQ